MPHYQYYRRAAIPTTPKERLRRRWFLATSALLLFIAFFTSSHHEPTVLADTLKPNPHPKTVLHAKPIDNGAIEKLITSDTEDQVGVAVRDLTSDETTTYGVDAPFVAASTTKVLSAVAYYHLVESGTLRADMKLGSFPAWFQVKQMLVNSSNDSWHVISSAIGNASLQAYATSLGMDFTQGPNTMSPSSMALLLDKLYSGALLNPEHTKVVLSYMRKTNNETLIPAAVGDAITTYHKYGYLDDELHDAAILTHGRNRYAVVIFTKGTGTTANRTELIHALTKAIIRTYNI